MATIKIKKWGKVVKQHVSTKAIRLFIAAVIEDLQEVRSQLLEVAVKWRDIGLELGLSDPQLERIRANNRDDVTDCLTAMLRDWLNRSYNTTRHGEPSWERLSEAVRHRAGGNNPALADLLIQNEFQRHI